MGAPPNNAAKIAELTARPVTSDGDSIYRAEMLALLTGDPVEVPGGTVGEHQHDETDKPVYDWFTCGACGLSWNNALLTRWSPTPSARCPFEYEDEHGEP